MPRGAEVVSGREIAITSSDFPPLTSPVCLLRTLSAAVPIGKPFGTTTVSRRKPVAALNVVTAVAVTVTGAPESGVNMTSLLDALALKPVPVIEIETDEDAPIGLTFESVPAATSTATARLRAAKIGTKERVGSSDSKGQYNQRGFFIATLRYSGSAGLRASRFGLARRAWASTERPPINKINVDGSGTGVGGSEAT